MRLILKHRTEITLFALICLAYFLGRLIHLTIIPIFVDEAIYTRWSQVILSDQSQWFIPLSDGKQPLFMWLSTLPLRIFKDPLFATRFISVLSGLVGMIATWFLAKELFNKKVALWSSILFVLCPFLMMYNRLAVPDGLLTTFVVLTVLFFVLVARTLRLDYALILGWIIGGGLLTKSTEAIVLLFLPFSLLFFSWKKKRNTGGLVKLVGLWLIALVSGFLLYNILHLSPLYYLIGQRTPDFIFSPKEVLTHPFDPFLGRFRDVTTWLWGYLTGGVFLMFLAGCILALWKKWREALVLGAFFFGPLFVEMEIAKGFTPRYFIFVAPFALIFAGYLVDYILQVVRSDKKKIFLALLLVLLVPAVLFEYQLLTNPQSAPIPVKEKSGYLEEWSAGYGIEEIAQYIKVQAMDGKPITVGTEGTQGYGTLPDGLQIYLRGISNVAVEGMGQRADIYSVPDDLIKDSKNHKAYLVVNDSRMWDKKNPSLHLIASYPKADGENPLLLYQINPISFVQLMVPQK